MLFLYALTLFVSAALLFLVQPMIAKMILPLLGGSPAVWNTCMVFFQAALLGGYLYSHLATTWLGTRAQALLHSILLLAPLAVLPVWVSESAIQSLSPEQNPIPWVLIVLLSSVGLPFFVTATSGPLLQKWFAGTSSPSAKDPYFLYAASNLGSMLALLGYPLLMEPNLRLLEQSWVWAAGYGLLVLLTAGCALTVLRKSVAAPFTGAESLTETGGVADAAPVKGAATEEQPSATLDSTVTGRRRLRWVLLAFAPSSLMLGVTTYLTTDIASIPLLWVIPLALYLLTFIFVFAQRTILPHTLMNWLMPLAVALFPVMNYYKTWTIWIPFHLLIFFLSAMVCHGELARDRPSTRHLTEFYLWMSVGGVLGGMFNALVAPVIFNRVWEYPLALVLACLLRPRLQRKPNDPIGAILDFIWPVGILMATAAVMRGIPLLKLDEKWEHTTAWSLGVLAASSCAFLTRPVRFALAIAAILIASETDSGVIHRDRSFFGVLKVWGNQTKNEPATYHQLVHGSTLHGKQWRDPRWREQPTSYYFRTGPVGKVFDAYHDRSPKPTIGVIGLGSGGLSPYARPGEEWTYYEIDPAVVQIARNLHLFTYVTDAENRGVRVRIVLGDARLQMRHAPAKEYGLIILDAFSSDAIPIHLLTKQALALYLEKLTDGGILAFHISNRYLDLQPVLTELARDAGLVCRVWEDSERISDDEKAQGKTNSEWAVLVRRDDDLGLLLTDERWKAPREDARVGLWTDDFSNIVSIFLWK